jgi:hypothetical protein
MDESLSPRGWEDATEELVFENRDQLHGNLIISDPAESLVSHEVAPELGNLV